MGQLPLKGRERARAPDSWWNGSPQAAGPAGPAGLAGMQALEAWTGASKDVAGRESILRSWFSHDHTTGCNPCSWPAPRGCLPSS